MTVTIESRRSAGRPTKDQVAAIDAGILDAARTAFCRQGFTEASMDEIAQTAGASKLTIYRRYPSKDALLIAVVENDITQMQERMAEVLAPDVEPLGALRCIARRLYDFSVEPDSLCFVPFMLWEAVRNPEIRERFKDWDRIICRPMVDLLVRAQDEGALDDKFSAEKLGEYLMELIDGLPMRMRLGLVCHESVDLDAEFEARWNAFLAIAKG